MSFLLTRVVALFGVLLLPAGGLAQTADEIVARNIQAKGGHARLKATTTVRTTARGSMQGQDVTIATVTKRPFLLRSEITATPPAGSGAQGAPQKMVQGYDGQTMWIAMGGMPPQALPAGPQTEAMKRTSHIDSPLLEYKEKGTTIELAEPSVEGGRTFHHLVVTPQGAPPMHYFIDASTHLESRMVIEVEEGGMKNRMEMRFSDFREIDGRMVPFAIDQFVNGTKAGEVRFEKIEFNVPIDDALFKMPR